MPRAGLSPQVVVDEAARLVDQTGPEGLSLSALATRLTVAQPSLYKHVAGLDDLHARLASLAASEVVDTVRRAVTGRARADAVQALAIAYRRYAREHPGRYRYILRPLPGNVEHAAVSAQLLEVLEAVLAGYGIADASALVDAVRFLRSALHGFVSLEIEGGFAMRRSVDASFDRLVDALDTAFLSWTPPRTA